MRRDAHIEWRDFSGPIRKGYREAIDKAMRKAVIDIVANTQTRMTDNDTINTGALRGSVYPVTPEHSGYADAAAAATAAAATPGRKTKKPNANFRMLPEVEINENQVAAAVGADYAVHVELGTVHSNAHPAFIPSSEEAIEAFSEVVTTLINEEVSDK